MAPGANEFDTLAVKGQSVNMLTLQAIWSALQLLKSSTKDKSGYRPCINTWVLHYNNILLTNTGGWLDFTCEPQFANP